MSYKSGKDVGLLGEDRSITTKRLWVARIVMLVWLAAAIPNWEGVFFALGNLFALTVIYWFLLRVLSNETDSHDSDQPSKDGSPSSAS